MRTQSMRLDSFRLEDASISDARFPALVDLAQRVLLDTWREEEPIVADWLRDNNELLSELRPWLWVVYDNTQPVATARLTIHPDVIDVPTSHLLSGLEDLFPAPIASLNRLAVLPAYQHCGIGRHLDEVRLARA